MIARYAMVPFASLCVLHTCTADTAGSTRHLLTTERDSSLSTPCWAVSSMEKVFQNSGPPSQPGAPISVDAAVGEHQAFQVACRPACFSGAPQRHCGGVGEQQLHSVRGARGCAGKRLGTDERRQPNWLLPRPAPAPKPVEWHHAACRHHNVPVDYYVCVGRHPTRPPLRKCIYPR